MGDVSDFITVHQEDLDERRFQICWSCQDGYRPTQPVNVVCALADGNRHLTVTLNDVVYFMDELVGEANGVKYDIKHSKKMDKVYVVVEKRDVGKWM